MTTTTSKASKRSRYAAARLVAAFVLLSLGSVLGIAAAFLVWIPLGVGLLALAALGLGCLILFL